MSAGNNGFFGFSNSGDTNRIYPVRPESLLCWLAADDPDLAQYCDGSQAMLWQDRSGHGYSPYRTGGTDVPLYKRNIKNGLPVIRSTSSRSYGWPIQNPASSYTLIVAASLLAGSGQYLIDSQSGRLIFAQGISGGTTVSWYDGSWHSIAAQTVGWQILTWVLTSGGNGEVFRNGVSLGTAAYSAKAIGGATILFADYSSSSLTSGDFGEIVMWNTALNSSELQVEWQRLNQKWSIY